MSDVVIRAENISKKYIIGHEKQASYSTFSESLSSAAHSIRNKILHPFSADNETTELEEFWALKDINFEIKQGDKVGIIGRNGAGKSTLLKILSRITEPTTGSIGIKGRVASLLEVGTGFHPELTGRENIFLNGTILGMTKKEVKKRFDEIVDFSGIEKFLDTPVKRYSSGMYVRLAFAVAAHLEPEILIIDEVLAVGDAEFQKKCLGKMDEVSQEGRTIIFVSHNMASLQSLCLSSIVMSDGAIKYTGKCFDAVNYYLNICKSINLFPKPVKSKDFELVNISYFQNKEETKSITEGIATEIVLYIRSQKEISATINISFSNSMNETMALISSKFQSNKIILQQGENHIKCLAYDLPFISGTYYLSIKIITNDGEVLWAPDFNSLEIVDGIRGAKIGAYKSWAGKVLISHEWSKR